MFASLLAAVLLTAAPGPLDVVKTGNADVQKVAYATGATVEQLPRVVESLRGLWELSKRALGEKGTSYRRPAQGVHRTMEGLLRASYAQKAIGQGKAEVQYGKEDVQGNEATVDTTVNVKRDQLPVEYKLYRASARPSGASTTSSPTTCRSWRRTSGQFRKLLADKGFDGLLTTLKAKRAQLEKENANTARPRERPKPSTGDAPHAGGAKASRVFFRPLPSARAEAFQARGLS